MIDILGLCQSPNTLTGEKEKRHGQEGSGGKSLEMEKHLFLLRSPN